MRVCTQAWHAASHCHCLPALTLCSLQLLHNLEHCNLLSSQIHLTCLLCCIMFLPFTLSGGLHKHHQHFIERVLRDYSWLRHLSVLLQCICSCPVSYANGPSMAPTMAPAMAPMADAAPEEDMSGFMATDGCNRPVPTKYEAFTDVSLYLYSLFATVGVLQLPV